MSFPIQNCLRCNQNELEFVSKNKVDFRCKNCSMLYRKIYVSKLYNNMIISIDDKYSLSWNSFDVLNDNSNCFIYRNNKYIYLSDNIPFNITKERLENILLLA
jgi:late competence protein required for DNA uptake (superfamily II DNA/RNA helicase)